MGTQHLTVEEQQAVRGSYDRLKHPALVSEATGASPAQVARVLRDAGVTRKHGRVGTCHRNHELLLRLCAEGATLLEMATRVGTNRKTVRGYIQLHEMPRPEYKHCSGPRNPMWRGGRTIDKDGYVLIWNPDHPSADRHNRVREHRLVMEKHLGRYLTPEEVVDHRNGVKGDNRLENLRLFATNGEHLRATLTGVPCPARGRSKEANRLARESGDRPSRRTGARSSS